MCCVRTGTSQRRKKISSHARKQDLGTYQGFFSKFPTSTPVLFIQEFSWALNVSLAAQLNLRTFSGTYSGTLQKKACHIKQCLLQVCPFHSTQNLVFCSLIHTHFLLRFHITFTPKQQTPLMKMSGTLDTLLRVKVSETANIVTYIHTYIIYLIKQVRDQNWQDAKS